MVQGGLSVDSSTKGIRVDTRKKHRLTTGKQKDGSPLLSTLDKKNVRLWKKNKPKNLCFEHFFAAEISYLYNIRRVLEPKRAICMVFQAFWPWIFELYLQLKSLVCRICAGFWNLNMQFALYLKRFGLEFLVCTVLAASGSQHLYYTWDYLQYFVVFATYWVDRGFAQTSSSLARTHVDLSLVLTLVWLGGQ